MKKKILATILAMTMIATSIQPPIKVQAESSSTAENSEGVVEQNDSATTTDGIEIVESGSCGDDATYTLDAEGTLVISGTEDGGYIEYCYFEQRQDIKKVVIEEGVKEIESYAFSECTNLEHVSIASGMTDIGYRAFGDCGSLSEVEIPGSVFDIGNNAFANAPEGFKIIGMKDSEAEVYALTNDITFEATEEKSISGISVESIGNKEYGINESVSVDDLNLRIRITFTDDSYLIRKSGFSVQADDSITSTEGKKNITISYKEYTTECEISVSATKGYWYEMIDESTIMITGYGGNATELVIPEEIDGYKVTSIDDYAYWEQNIISAEIPSTISNIGNQSIGYHYITDDELEKTENFKIIGMTDSEAEAYASENGFTFESNGQKQISGISIESPSNVLEYDINEEIEPYGLVLKIEFTDGTYVLRRTGFQLSADTSSEGEKTVAVTYKAYTTSYQITVKSGASLEYKVLEDGTIEIVGQNREHSVLKIPGKIEGKTVSRIGDSAFRYCSGLTSIEIPEGVTSIGSNAFYCCRNLETIQLPSSLKNVGEDAFLSTKWFISQPDGLVCIGETAYAYKGETDDITSIEIPEGITVILDVFSNCKNLTAITLPESLQRIGRYAFSNCSSLINIEIPDSVTSIGYDAFYNCSSLTSIEIPDSVTCIEYETFKNCSSLTSIEIPENVTSIGNRAFYGCSNLESIVFPSNISDIGESAFEGTKWLENQADGFVCFGNTLHTYKGDKNTLTSAKIPDGVEVIGEAALLNCVNLKSVEIPDSVTSIGDYAFSGCASLSSIEIPDSVTSIGDYAFSNCTSLGNVALLEGITTIGNGIFLGCTSLESIELPNDITSIKSEMFLGCTSLNNIKIPEGVTNVEEDAFQGCTSLKSVELPKSVTDIGLGIFSGCTSLERIELPGDITCIAGWMFSGCTSLSSIEIPEGVKSIEGYAFEDCKKLESIKLPENLENIEYYAFGNCISLKSITIPKSVTEIGTGALGYEKYEYYEEYDDEDYDDEDDEESEDGEDGYWDFDWEKMSEFTLYCYPDSVAQEYAEKEGIEYELIVDSFFAVGETKEISQKAGEKTEFALKCEESGDYILRYTNPIDREAKVQVTVSWKDASTATTNTFYKWIKPFKEFTGTMDDLYNEANISIPMEVGVVYHITIEEKLDKDAVAKDLNYQLYFAKQPKVTGIKVDNDSYVVRAGGYNWWGLSGWAFEVTYDDGSVQHLHGPRGRHPETEASDPYLPYDDYGNSFTFALKDNSQKENLENLVAGEYPATITVSDGQVYEDILKIQKGSLEQAEITLSSTSYIYTGAALTPELKEVKAYFETLREGTDYTVSYTNNINVGTATVTITGKGNYTGTATATFTIQPLSIEKANVTLSATEYTYDGAEKKPTATVKLGDKTLQNNTDYTVSYENNKKAGTATVIITGKGNYTGTAKTSFIIKEKATTQTPTKTNIAKATVTLSETSVTYDGTAKQPSITVKYGNTVLKKDVDYAIAYKNNTNIGTATVTITGKGNYTGTITKTFKITVKKGKTFTVGSYKYKITGSSTVAFAGLKKNNTTKVTIPSKVKIGGKTFKVTSVAAKALYKKTKVKSVTIGTNVKTIGKSAFHGCKKLNSITIKTTKLKTVGKNALKGIKSTAKISVPKKKLKDYKKLLKGKGQGSKVKVVKK